MGVNATQKQIPGHGTVFFAAPNTLPGPNPLANFSLTTGPSGWENLGHTSKDNLPSFSRDGGDVNKLDSWLVDGIGTIVDAVAWSLGINPIQVDKNVLDMAFQGFIDSDGGYVIPSASNGLAKALFLYMTDGTGQLGFWMPSTTLFLGDVPSFDPSKFVEMPLSASISPVTDTAVIPATNGTPGLMKLYKSGLTVLTPTVLTVTPSGQGTGAQVVITGYNLTGATAVKFGSTTAQFTVIDDTRIVATLPTGSAGSSPVTVTNATGTSSPVAYTRAA